MLSFVKSTETRMRFRYESSNGQAESIGKSKVLEDSLPGKLKGVLEEHLWDHLYDGTLRFSVGVMDIEGKGVNVDVSEVDGLKVTGREAVETLAFIDLTFK